MRNVFSQCLFIVMCGCAGDDGRGVVRHIRGDSSNIGTDDITRIALDSIRDHLGVTDKPSYIHCCPNT